MASSEVQAFFSFSGFFLALLLYHVLSFLSILRGFYLARGETNVILNLVLIHFLGVNGLALATSLSAIITFFVRIKLAEKYVSLDNKQMIVTGIKVLIASAIACMIPRTIFWIHPINIYLTLVISSLLGVAIYLGVVKMLKVHEINDLIELLKRKFKKT